MSRTVKETARAYEQFCDELSNVLYDEDPAAIGKSISAPRDEYDGLAARLATALKNASSRDQVAAILEQFFQTRSMRLITRVERALTKFRWRTSA